VMRRAIGVFAGWAPRMSTPNWRGRRRGAPWRRSRLTACRNAGATIAPGSRVQEMAPGLRHVRRPAVYHAVAVGSGVEGPWPILSASEEGGVCMQKRTAFASESV